MLRIIVLEGDETGQDLLEQALRVIDPTVTGVEAEQSPSRFSAGITSGASEPPVISPA